MVVSLPHCGKRSEVTQRTEARMVKGMEILSLEGEEREWGCLARKRDYSEGCHGKESCCVCVTGSKFSLLAARQANKSETRC